MPSSGTTLQHSLLTWYDCERRALPWRSDRDSYRVWVAETMLQQTRVASVIPIFAAFVDRFPTIAALAAASEDQVLSAWSGLGYYSRARNLWRAAQHLDRAGRATFPQTYAEAVALPGVGAYTAAAVLSIAYDQCHAPIDANIRRVLARLFCLSSPQDVARTAEQLLDRDRPGDWNQALMELGETICTAAAPRCTVCPWRRRCRARCGDRVASYPPAKARRRRERIDVELLLLQDAAGRLLLERGEFPYLRHLWLPLWHRPNLRSDRAAVLGELRHAILHRDLRVTVYGQVVASRRMQALAAEKGELGRRIFAPAELQQIGRSSLLTKSLRLARLV